MTKPLLLALCGAACLLACGEKPAEVLHPPKAPAVVPRPTLATLTAVQGEVGRIPKAGAKVAGRAGDGLSEGDAVETSAGASATVQLPGRSVELGELGRIVIGSGKDRAVSLELASGIILSRTAASTDGKSSVELQVLTPFGLTRIASDDGSASEVSLHASSSGAELQVLLGTVSVVARTSQAVQSQRVGAGEKLELSLGTITFVPKPAPPQVAVSIEASGITLLREAGHRPRRVAHGAQKLPPDSQVQVMTGAVELHLGRIDAHLSKAGRARLGPPGTADSPQTLELELGKAGLSAAAGPGAPLALRVGEAVLHAPGEAQFALEASRRQKKLVVRTGTLQVERGGQKLELHAGEQADLGARSLAAAPAPQPEVVVGGGHRTLYGISAIDRLAIAWPAEACTDCRVEVASEPGFTQLLVHGPVYRPRVVVPARRGVMYWRVFSGTRQVEAGVVVCAEERLGGEHLSNPHNDVRDNGVKTVVYFQSKLPELTLTWAKLERAATYRVRIFPADRLTQPAVDREVAEPKLQLAAGQLPEGSFFWSQTPLDAAHHELSGGRMNPLEIAYDNSVPVLAILAPRPGQVVGRRTRLSAIAPLGSRVSLGGQALRVDIKGRIAQQISVPRSGLLIFRVERAGSEELYLRRVRVH